MKQDDLDDQFKDRFIDPYDCDEEVKLKQPCSQGSLLCSLSDPLTKETVMKQHVLTTGDICIHCGGNSGSPIECIDRTPQIIPCSCSHCEGDPQLSELHARLQGGHA